MKRRALLAGVGLSTVGVGAAFGSGAFTTVSADRSVELEVKSDADARIGFEPGSGASHIIETTDESGDAASVIKLTQSDLNEQAKTSFSEALTITNNGTGSSAPNVDLYVEDSDLLGGTWDSANGDEETDDILDFQKNSDMPQGSKIPIGPNAAIFVDYEEGGILNPELITYYPESPSLTLSLHELEIWVNEAIRRKSHYVVVVLTLIWTTSSLLSTAV